MRGQLARTIALALAAGLYIKSSIPNFPSPPPCRRDKSFRPETSHLGLRNPEDRYTSSPSTHAEASLDLEEDAVMNAMDGTFNLRPLDAAHGVVASLGAFQSLARRCIGTYFTNLRDGRRKIVSTIEPRLFV